MRTSIAKLWIDQEGIATIEYAVLLAALIIGAAVIWIGLTGHIRTSVANAEACFD